MASPPSYVDHVLQVMLLYIFTILCALLCNDCPIHDQIVTETWLAIMININAWKMLTIKVALFQWKVFPNEKIYKNYDSFFMSGSHRIYEKIFRTSGLRVKTGKAMIYHYDSPLKLAFGNCHATSKANGDEWKLNDWRATLRHSFCEQKGKYPLSHKSFWFFCLLGNYIPLPSLAHQDWIMSSVFLFIRFCKKNL